MEKRKAIFGARDKSLILSGIILIFSVYAFFSFSDLMHSIPLLTLISFIPSIRAISKQTAISGTNAPPKKHHRILAVLIMAVQCLFLFLWVFFLVESLQLHGML